MISSYLCSCKHETFEDGGPANTRHWTNVGLMLGHRLRRRPNINPTLVQCLVFAAGPTWIQHWVNASCLLRCPGRVYNVNYNTFSLWHRHRVQLYEMSGNYLVRSQMILQPEVTVSNLACMHGDDCWSTMVDRRKVAYIPENTSAQCWNNIG